MIDAKKIEKGLEYLDITFKSEIHIAVALAANAILFFYFALNMETGQYDSD